MCLLTAAAVAAVVTRLSCDVLPSDAVTQYGCKFILGTMNSTMQRFVGTQDRRIQRYSAAIAHAARRRRQHQVAGE